MARQAISLVRDEVLEQAKAISHDPDAEYH